MSYLVLARKWRPQTFTDVVGQEHVTRTLRNAIASGRVAHAFLFTGPRGVGKTTTARLLAKALNCEHGPTPDPCNTCLNCTEIMAGNALDVLEIDGASHTGVDNIRDLTEGVQYRPVKSRFRIIIIDEVHMLSNAAFNALLKTLEEPPPHVKFIFATTESNKILPTIASRCQRYDFKRIPLRELIEKLQVISQQEGLTVDDVGLALLAREADGSLRDAESLLDQVMAWGGGAITEQSVREALGVADRQILFRVVDAVLAHDPATALQLAGDLSQYGYDPRRLCRDLLEHVRNLVLAKVSPEAIRLADLPDHEVAAVQKQVETPSLEDLQRLFTIALHAEEEVSRTAYTQLVVEMSLVKLATLPPVLPIEAVLAQLEALAGKPGTGSGEPLPASSSATLASGSPPRPVRPNLTESNTGRPSFSIRRENSSASPQSPSDFPSSSSPRVAESGEPGTNASQSIDADLQSVWERLLAAVQKEKISLFFALKSGRPLALTQGSLQIGVDKDPYFKEITRNENRTLMEEAARRIMGRTLTIEVTKGGKSPQASASGETGTARAPIPAAPTKVQNGENNDPLVKTVLDVLGGEVQMTRSHRMSGEPSR